MKKVKLLLKGTKPGDAALDELFIKNKFKGHIDDQRTNTDILNDNKELTKMLG